MKYKSTIFRQIVLKITIPVIIALLIFAKLNFDNTKDMLVNSSKQKSELISDEIHHIFKFKELALEDLETELETEMKRLSNRLVNYYFDNSDSLQFVNLDSIRNILGVDTSLVDLYIIDTNKVVINTTMKSDLNIDLTSFGEEFAVFLDERFNDSEFYCSRFGIEIKTNNLKKYSYEVSNDGNYLIEIGHYSSRADEIIKTFNSRLDSISNKQKSILNVELFVDDHNPLTLNKAKQLPAIHREVLAQTFKDHSTHTLVEIEDDVKIHYEYIYSEDENGTNDFGSVVRIKSNKSIEDEMVRNSFIRTLLIFGGTILTLIILLFLNARNISKPIKQLVTRVDEAINGNMKVRVEVSGNNEIAALTDQFNQLIERLDKAESEVNKQKSTLEEQSDEIKSKSEGVSDSIKYAHKIQHTLLPSEQKIAQLFKKTFTFYRTKDIVSGDLFWFETYSDLKFFGVIDCTGHGVPGAFVSLVSQNALNRSIREFKLTDPGQILDKMNELFEEILRQRESESKDQVDISLCCYSEKEGKVFFAGANNPLVICRPESNGNVIINNSWSEPKLKNKEYLLYDIRGDRKSIGNYDSEILNFKTNEIEVKAGDRIYVYTDGIVDQFGGPDGKKFRAKNLRSMILKAQEVDFVKQKQFIEVSIEEWKQGDKYELLDDMCIVAVEIT